MGKESPNSKSAKNYISALRNCFELQRNTGDAIAMKKYMKNYFEFFGIKSESRRLISKEFGKLYPLKENESDEIILLLWNEPERELQYHAIDLILKNRKTFEEKDIILLEKLIVIKSWWDTVDALAANLVGFWMKKFPHHIQGITNKWNKSENIWLQRTSLLFQLKYKSETDVELLVSYINHLANSKEFFIRKAIGWALREYSKTDANFVKKYVASSNISSFSKKEALKFIEKKQNIKI